MADRSNYTEEQRRREIEYSRKWNRANPDNVENTMKRFRINHREQLRIQQQEYRDTNHEVSLDNAERARWKARGLPTPTRPRPEGCEACGERDERTRLHLDHDHSTGKFRGWLCGACNFAAGHSKDSPARLRGVADYLERNT